MTDNKPLTMDDLIRVLKYRPVHAQPTLTHKPLRKHVLDWRGWIPTALVIVIMDSLSVVTGVPEFVIGIGLLVVILGLRRISHE